MPLREARTGLALLLQVAVLLQFPLALWAQDDPDETIRKLIAEVGGRLEYALRLQQTDAIDLRSVRIEYVMSADGVAAEGASVGLRAPDAPEAGDDPFRQVCWALHSLQGDRAYRALLDRPEATDKAPLDMTISVGWTLATEWCENDPVRLAVVIGHELGHVVLGHLVAAPQRGPDVLELARLNQEREFAADERGIELALAAGYEDAVTAATTFWQRFAASKGDAAALEPNAALSTHPTVSERVAQMQRDAQSEGRWRSLIVYDYGLTYLQIGDWPAAQDCFERTLAAFPGSREVLSNLAYSKMMRYYSSLNEAERLLLGGEVSCQAFVTARPPIRGGTGTDKTPLLEAVAHLRVVLAGDPEYLPARVMLGTATVMDPDADGEALEAAARELAKAAQDAARQQSAADSRAARRSAADLFADALANGALAQARARPDKALEVYQDAWRQAPVDSPIQALQLNLAAALVPQDDLQQVREARELLSDYLLAVSEESYYHRTAMSLWSRVGAKLGEAQASAPARGKSRWLPAKSVPLGNGRTVFLGSDWTLVKRWLDDWEVCQVPVGGVDTVADCRDTGLQLRVSRGVVKCILLVSPAAPVVVLRSSRTGTGPTLSLRVGQRPLVSSPGGEGEPAGESELGDRIYRATIGGREYNVYRDCQLAIAWDGDTIAAIAMLGA